MADLEGGGHFGLVYEYRDPCNVIALAQLVVTLVSFIFTYPVWWAGFFGVIVAAMGYYGSAQPVIQSKTSFIQFVRELHLLHWGSWPLTCDFIMASITSAIASCSCCKSSRS
jgi:hypothetical protein